MAHLEAEALMRALGGAGTLGRKVLFNAGSVCSVGCL